MRVLVVEDEVNLAEVIRDGLTEQGLIVDVEHDGAAGLWRAREGSYDVIVLDLMLPKKNGFLVCRELRAAGNWTPILMLTAKDGVYDEAEALDTGADDYLTKPFSFVVLLARLRALARRPPAERPAVLQAGDLTFDVEMAEVRRGDEQVQLSATELAVLEVLMRAGTKPVSKQQIFRHVWGFDSHIDPKIVEVYIRYLRRKLDEPFGTKSIVNQRGVGYRIVES